MSQTTHTLVHHTHGGMLSVQDFRALAELALAQGEGQLHATGRQDLLVQGLHASAVMRLLKAPQTRLEIWKADLAPSIVTTASALGAPGSSEWLTPGLLGEIVAALQPLVTTPLTIADAAQTVVPVTTSPVCLIAAAQRDLWHLRAYDTYLPGAVRTPDLAEVFARSQQWLGNAEHLPQLVEAIRGHRFDLDAPPASNAPVYGAPPDALIVPMAGGIPARFAIDLCLLAAACPQAALSITPWRELCLRGLDAEAMRRARVAMLQERVAAIGPWRRLLCSDALLPDALRLREALARVCGSDAMLSWTVAEAGDFLPEAHVAITRASRGRLRAAHFSVLVREGLAARTGAWRVAAKNLRERDVPATLLRALSGATAEPSTAKSVAEPSRSPLALCHTCTECFTEYSAAYGDPGAGIAQGTPFTGLPASWACPVCGAGKNKYARAA